MAELLQYAPHLGPSLAVLCVVVLFLRFLRGERAADRALALRVARALNRNTRAHVRSAAVMERVEAVLTRLVGPDDTPARQVPSATVPGRRELRSTATVARPP